MREFIDALARTPQSTIFLVALGLTALRLVVFPVLRKTAKHLRGGGYSGARGINEIADSLVYAAILIFFLVRPFVFQTFVIPTGSMVPTLLVGDYIGLNKAIYRYTEPKVFDIVVFRPPKIAVSPTQVDDAGNVNVDFVKRLIGTPGDLVELREGVLFRNGQRVEQPWVHYMSSIPGTNNTLYRDIDSSLLPRPLPSFKLVKRKGKVISLNYDNEYVNSGPLFGPPNVSPEFEPDTFAEGRELVASPAEKVPEGYYLFMGDNRFNSFDGRGWGLVPKEAIVGRAEFIWLPFNRIGSLRGR